MGSMSTFENDYRKAKAIEKSDKKGHTTTPASANGQAKTESKQSIQKRNYHTIWWKTHLF
jgi:hypothetical protein